MDINLLVILLIVFMTMSSSVILLKFWMDFKLSVWDRKNQISFYESRVAVKDKFISNTLRDKIYNKKKSKDIIIDCEVEVLDPVQSADFVYVKKERLLK